MIHLPILRWGQPYESLEKRTLQHFATGETIAEISQTNAALVERDLQAGTLVASFPERVPTGKALVIESAIASDPKLNTLVDLLAQRG